ncbi:transcription factor A, mitochondrial-like [Actinia tenebrosa]|uniref:Transcription factor A, mitochondrial-like n=1 Tax=Actinia tenebrosa TaxID=6105 RepID=A0A6P8I010_ACTTE|nr:transcription factor A, mitochondrial-like [Actinia tenebrosa]
MSLMMLRRMALQHSRTVYKIMPREYTSDGKINKEARTKPSKPPSVFDLFYEDHIEEERANNAHSKQNELIRAIGEKWKNTTEDQKKAYREKFVERVEQYKQQLISFEEGLDAHQKVIEALKQNACEHVSEQEDSTISMDLPKKATAFGHFIKAAQEAFPRDSTQSIAEWNIQMAKKWRDMSEEDKQSFREASKESSQKFEVEKDDPKSMFSVDEVGGFQR